MTAFHFVLLHDTQLSPVTTTYASPLYDSVKADPPAGCTPQDFRPYFGLECVREADTKWQAITELIGEIRSRFGLIFNDLGYERFYEWSGGDADGMGPEIVAQLLSMAAVRARLAGLNVDQLTAFLRAVEPPID